MADAGKRRNAVYAAIGIFIGVVAACGMLELALRMLPVTESLDRQAVDESHPYLHFRPNNDVYYSKGWNFAIVNRAHINNFGFVNDQDYDPAATTPLLAVIGDSYVEAVHVPYRDTIYGRLAQAAGDRGRVYSFGVSGSPLSQYLAYARLAKEQFRPDGLVVVVIGNDFDESLLEYTAYPGMHHFRENADGSLALELVPFRPSFWYRASRSSALEQYLNGNIPAAVQRVRLWFAGGEFVGNVSAEPDETRLAKSRKAVDHFLDVLPRHAGLAPERIAFVVDGTRTFLYDAKALESVSGTYFVLMRRYFMERAREHGYAVLDMEPRFIARHARDGVRFEWEIDHHWNAYGYEEAAAAVLESGLPQKVFGPLPAHQQMR